MNLLHYNHLILTLCKNLDIVKSFSATFHPKSLKTCENTASVIIKKQQSFSFIVAK